MFYDNLKSECDRQGLKISNVVTECGGAIGSIGGWKKGAIPNGSIVISLALRLNVTTDYLLTGKKNIEKQNTFTQNEEELLAVFRQFSAREQIKVIGQVENILNQYKNMNEPKENAG